MKQLIPASFTLWLCACGSAFAGGTHQESFTWHGNIAPGKTLYLRNLNGAIRAQSVLGSEVRVRAVKRSPERDLDQVQIAVVEHDGGATICALWNAERSACGPNGRYGRNDSKDVKAQVEFEVDLPRGVNLDAETVNGTLMLQAETSAVRAVTVNGNVELTTPGPGEARTANGRVRADIRGGGRGDIALESINGSIDVHLPNKINADTDSSVVNGRIRSRVDIRAADRSTHHLRGRIGSGGRMLSMRTVNGSINIE
jgi:hypothetical protein